ncbi:MAG: hypothetical protein RQ743_06690, partial [Bacteroidales bacterium]|nr:hypothetical protein [Bacteroidales bacterium]
MGHYKFLLTLLISILLVSPVFSQSAGDDQTVCGSLITTLDGSNPAPNSGEWTVVGTPPGSVTFDDDTTYNTGVRVGEYGTYTFKWTVETLGSDDVVINFVDPPVATAINNGPVCVGKPLSLTGGPTGTGYSHSWSGPGGFSSNQPSPTVAAAATLAMAGDYTLLVTDTYGCQDSATTTVVVNTLPSPLADNNGPICVGTQLTLSAAPDDMVSYNWEGPAGFAVNNQNPVVSDIATPDMAGEYTVTVVDVNGCENSASTEVTINPLPTASIDGTTAVCKDDPPPYVLFTGANGTAPYTFTYRINGGALQYVTTSGGNSVSVSAPTGNAGIFTYTLVSVKDASSTECEQAQTGSATVTVNPLPTATISGNNAVCQYDPSPVITFTGANGTPPYTFTYSVNSGSSRTVSTTGSNSSVTVAVPTNNAGSFTYALISVRDGSASACSQSQGGSATVVVNSMPTATISGSTEVCQGEASPSVVFTGANGILPYTFTYTLNGGTNQSITTTSTSNNATLPVSTSTAGTYSYELVSVRDGSSTSCEQAQEGSAVLTVNPLPDATISGTTEVCRYDPEPEITFTGSNGTPPYEFTYTINSGPGYVVVTTSGSSVSLPVPTGTVGSFT